MKIKKFFKGWNLFEKIWLGLIFILPIVFSIIFKSSVIECITTITYLLCAILVSKGKHYAYPIGIISLILYAYVSYSVGYYGEVIISIVLLLPTMIIGLISWIKNRRIDEKQGDVVVVNKVSKKEFSLLILSQIVLGGGVLLPAESI